MQSCNLHHSRNKEQFPHPKKLSFAPLHSPSSPTPGCSNHWLLFVATVLFFLEFDINGAIEYTGFCFFFLCFTSFISIRHLRLIHVVAYSSTSFLFIAKKFSIIWATTIHLSICSVVEHLGCSQFKAAMNNLWFPDRHFRGHMFSFILGKYPGTGLWSYIINVCLTLQGSAISFSKVAGHFTFLPAGYEHLSCSPFSPIVGIVSLFKFNGWISRDD